LLESVPPVCCLNSNRTVTLNVLKHAVFSTLHYKRIRGDMIEAYKIHDTSTALPIIKSSFYSYNR